MREGPRAPADASITSHPMHPPRSLAGSAWLLLASAFPAVAQERTVYPAGVITVRAEPSRADGLSVPQPPRALQAPPKGAIPTVPVRDAGLPQPGGPPARMEHAGPAAPCDFRMRTHRIVDPPGSAKATVGEPTVALRGDTDPTSTQAFYTANWFGGLSTDSGVTWSHVNPYTKFGAVDGGFCCDQATVYAPSVDAMIWYLQYQYSATTQRGSVRIAIAAGANLASGNWPSYVLWPQLFGRPSGEWFDYPDVAVSDTHAYFSSNIFDAGGQYRDSLVWTMRLTDMIAGNAPVWYWFASGVQAGGSIRFTRGASATIYAGSHRTTATIRVLEITGHTLVGFDNNHPSWVPAPYVSLTPTGVNWAGRVDNRITGAYQTATEYGFLWMAAPTTGRPHPYVRVARFRVADDAHIADDDLWNEAGALLYPSAAANDAGHVALVTAYGGASAHPATYCALVDDCAPSFWGQALFSLGSSTHSPAFAGWGDYYSVQRHPVRSLGFVGSGMGQLGGSANANQTFTWAWFNRERDDPAWVNVTVRSNPVQGIQVACSPDQLGRTSVTTNGYLGYVANASYSLNAPPVVPVNGRVLVFRNWTHRGQPYGPLTQVSTSPNHQFGNDARDDVAEANYEEAHRLVVGSRNPTSGVTIAPDQVDLLGGGSGATPFTRHFGSALPVMLTAPPILGALRHPFHRWWLGGVPQPIGVRVLTVNLPAGPGETVVEAEYLTRTPGSALTYGAGCPGSNAQVPELSVSRPERGTNVTFTLANVFGPTACSMSIGLSRTTWLGLPLPLNLGFVGLGATCFAHASDDLALPISTAANGTGSVTIPLPPDLAIGAHLYLQTRVFDPGVATPVKIVLSNAVDVTIGGVE